MSWQDSFAADVRDFQPLASESVDAKPCGECPAATMYADVVGALVAEPDPEFRKAVAARWYCHMQCNRRCRGVRDAIEDAA